MKSLRLLGLLQLLSSFPIYAAGPLRSAEIPPALRAWSDWVLYGDNSRGCAFLNDKPTERPCLWPSSLSLEVDKAAGSFRLQIYAEADQVTTLPGDAMHWPLDVKLDGRTAIVIARGDSPSIQVPTGMHVITGVFAWPRLPSTLKIDPQVGLLNLMIQGKKMTRPRLSDEGQVLLARAEEAGVPDGNDSEMRRDSLELHVYRQLADEIPMLLTTSLDLIVSGRNREIILGPILPAGFQGNQISSPLPAQLEAGSLLRLALRPGRWRVDIQARHHTLPKSITRPAAAAPWPATELWTFLAFPELRVATLAGKGVTAIDPQQTDLPAEWRGQPTFLVTADSEVTLSERERGLPLARPNDIHLQRDIWVDFNGDGYTLLDQLSGSIPRSDRLDARKPLTLSRVSVNGQDRLITQFDDQSSGVELRTQKLNVLAESRIERQGAQLWRLPAVGWNQDLQSLKTTLHLPPGWSLLAVGGADAASMTWIWRWNLEKLFLLLIVSVGFFRLYGRLAGVVSFTLLLLTLVEAQAPQYLWLALVIGLALSRILPSGRFKWLLQSYKIGVILLLTINCLQYVTSQLRQTLYPTLEDPHATFTQGLSKSVSLAAADEASNYEAAIVEAADVGEAAMKNVAPSPAAPPAKLKNGTIGGRPMIDRTHANSPNRTVKEDLTALDPNDRVQTGNGTPTWRWKNSELTWNGPVKHDQSLTLWLLPRWCTALLNIVKIILLLTLITLITRRDRAHDLWILVQKFLQFNKSAKSASLVIGGLGLASLLAVYSSKSYANDAMPTHSEQNAWPPENLLHQLRERLLAPPDCAPSCATFTRLVIKINADELRLQLDVSSAAATAIALPGYGYNIHSGDGDSQAPANSHNGSRWSATSVNLIGAEHAPLRQDERGHLWLLLPQGASKVIMSGALPPRQSSIQTVELALPTLPRHVSVESDSASGWTIEGLNDDGQSLGNLVLKRADPSSPPVVKTLPSPTVADLGLVPLVRVVRQLQLGFHWTVRTRIERLAGRDALTLRIPLLTTEQVTTAGLKFEQNHALVTLGADQDTVMWDSSLAITPELVLQAVAAPTAPWWEVWQVTYSSIWHMQPTGIPPVQVFNPEGDREVIFRPWPGERVTLSLKKPAAAAGPHITLSQSTTVVTPGSRSSEVEVNMVWRASQNLEQVLTLPAGAELNAATRAGEPLKLRLEGKQLYMPLQAGEQHIQLKLRLDEGGRFFYRTPAVQPGLPSANASLTLKPTPGRWLLFLGGDGYGPALHIWSQIILTALLALLLKNIPLTPLTGWQWFMLGLGMSQASFSQLLVVYGFFLVLGLRGYGWRYLQLPKQKLLFNLTQILLVIWAIAAATGVLAALQAGFFGSPEMQIKGNGSSPEALNFFTDRMQDMLPRAWMISLPTIAYQGMMLLWALWFALALVRWAKWGFECVSAGGVWQDIGLWRRKAKKAKLDGN